MLYFRISYSKENASDLMGNKWNYGTIKTDKYE
jgi:hypothetical protein